MKDFYLTLLSDSSLDTFSKNKQHSFTVKLDHPILIEKDQWEVGLVEMITPTEVKNIKGDNNIFYLRFYDKELCTNLENCIDSPFHVDMKLYIPQGFYSSPQHLVEEIQNQINTLETHLTARNINVEVKYGKNTERVKLNFKNPRKLKLIFPKGLGEILGLHHIYFDEPVGDEKFAFKYGVDLNTSIHQLYVYSDIASYTFIGDVTAPILRVLPFYKKKETNHLHQEFVNVHYVPVAKSYIDQVHISIKGDTGEDVPFISGKTLVKLHFRQKH